MLAAGGTDFGKTLQSGKMRGVLMGFSILSGQDPNPTRSKHGRRGRHGRFDPKHEAVSIGLIQPLVVEEDGERGED